MHRAIGDFKSVISRRNDVTMADQKTSAELSENKFEIVFLSENRK